MILNIITPSCQPENLKLLEKSIVAAVRDLPIAVNWFIYYPLDKSDIPLAKPDSRLRTTQTGFTSEKSISDLLNWCLDDIKEGFVYVLADDTLIHPQLLLELLQQQKINPQLKLMVVGQYLEDDMVREPLIEPGMISFNQYLVDRQAIQTQYIDHPKADGIFVNEIYQEWMNDTTIINKPLSYAKKIRELELLEKAPDSFGVGSVVTINQQYFEEVFSKIRPTNEKNLRMQGTAVRLRRHIGKKVLITNIMEEEDVYLVTILPLRKSHISWRKGKGTVMKFFGKHHALNVFKLIEKITPDAL